MGPQSDANDDSDIEKLCFLGGNGMDILIRAYRKFAREYFRRHYRRVAGRITELPPMRAGRQPFTQLSMVHHRDVISYLVAARTFAQVTDPQRIVVVADPTLNAEDRSIISRQIPHVEFRDADEFTHKAIPRGGCWERLFAISEYSPDGYVVQLDADTITASNLTEVLSAVASGRGFVLGEAVDQRLVSFQAASEAAKRILGPKPHIQTRSEAALVDTGLPPETLYVRGCAGFTGFPSMDNMRDQIIDFSSRMRSLLGDDWASWGTEQVTSNYIVANADRTEVLPYPKYSTPEGDISAIAFFHFIGSIRFESAMYANVSAQAIGAVGSRS